MRRAFAWALAAAVASAGSCICVERPKRITDDERGRLQGMILADVPPTMQHRVGANLDGRIELVGYDLKADRDAQGRIVPGKSITVTWYWRCLEPLEEGWKLFTHVVDAAGENRVPADNRGLVREHYPPSAWRRGQVIVDEQLIPIPQDFNSKTLTLYIGAWYGPHRLPIADADRIPNDGTGRIRIGPFDVQFETTGAAIPRTTGAITLDGRLDEPAWAAAAVLGPFVPTPDGPPAEGRVTARAMWSPRHLYVAFEVADRAIVSQFTERDSPIYTQDVVEVFLDEDGDGRDYYEFEVSPAGVLFDAHFSERRRGEAKQFTASDFLAGVSLDGTLNDAAQDRGYTVELQIPFASLAKFKQRTPTAGTVWRANFYVLDMLDLPQGPDQQPQPPQEGFAWSAPRSGDFHEHRRFGELRFAGPVDARTAAGFEPPVGEPEPPAGVSPQPGDEPAQPRVQDPPGNASGRPPIRPMDLARPLRAVPLDQPAPPQQ
ncbi:MAG: carbohydrate-binding family 9-like protein [Myxococcota bacterium]|nr:carbohydrate-binding family 9-like protein [Myxococcota bacterium]